MILVLSPINSMVYKSDGVLISSVAKNFSAEKSGMRDNEIMLWIDNDSIRSVPDVTKSLSSKKPGDNVIVRTNVTAYNVELSKNPSNSSSAYLGVFLDNHYSLRSDLKPFSFGFKIYDWVAAFFFWLFLLNLGVGLFNLAPLGIVDGGRMLQVGLYYIIPDQKKSDMVWKGISLFFLVIVLALLFIGFFH
jgi:membrane-associated protease RseP (regulator of RpoE activity)